MLAAAAATAAEKGAEAFPQKTLSATRFNQGRRGLEPLASAGKPSFATTPQHHNTTHNNTPTPARLIQEGTWLYLEPECVADVVDNLGHLIPGKAPRELLLDDPSWLLRAQRGQRWLGEHPDSTMESIYWTSD